MSHLTRRTFTQTVVGLPIISGSAVLTGCVTGAPLERNEGETAASGGAWRHLRWARGIEGQRKADLGDGRFLNPVFSGDRPDPSLLRDGDTYYMTFSSFESYPGLVIWESVDLLNWQVVTAALTTPVGSVWAPDLCKHGDRYFIYFPARTADRRSNYVVWADHIRGPWSEPVDLGLSAYIDPGHAAEPGGPRYLFLSGGDRVRLTPDGLATEGPVERVYQPWRYPETWTVESFSPEGPKLVRRGEYWYLVTAVGGTAGPPTGHMVIVARARTLDGPWEDCPYNPVVRTWSAEEKWWSRGHATMFEARDGSWWMVCHGYENDFWTLGRQTLLAPVRWSADGWPIPEGGDLSVPLRAPRATAQSRPDAAPGGSHNQPHSDDFGRDRLGTLWAFHRPGPNEAERLEWGAGGLRMAASGSGPSDGAVLTQIAGDLSYEVEADFELPEGDATEAGLLLFYSRRLYVGLGFDTSGLIMHRYGRPRRARAPQDFGRRLQVRLRNDRHIVTLWTRTPSMAWTRFGVQMEVSGYHHNTDGDFFSLRPALYVAQTGAARIRTFMYRSL